MHIWCANRVITQVSANCATQCARHDTNHTTAPHASRQCLATVALPLRPSVHARRATLMWFGILPWARLPSAAHANKPSCGCRRAGLPLKHADSRHRATDLVGQTATHNEVAACRACLSAAPTPWLWACIGCGASRAFGRGEFVLHELDFGLHCSCSKLQTGFIRRGCLGRSRAHEG